MMIKHIVNNLKNIYKTNNAFSIIKELNGIVLFVPLVDVNGFYQNYKGIDIVYINESLTEREQQIVASHELGHMILHKDLNYFFLSQNTYDLTKKYEREANIFAVELLIGDEQIYNEIITKTTISKQDLSFLFGVDEYLIDLKFLNLEKKL